jgi:hypothetical protein
MHKTRQDKTRPVGTWPPPPPPVQPLPQLVLLLRRPGRRQSYTSAGSLGFLSLAEPQALGLCIQGAGALAHGLGLVGLVVATGGCSVLIREAQLWTG